MRAEAVGNAEHRGLGHAVHAKQHFLQQFRRELRSADVDQVVVAAADHQDAVVGHHADVARVVPAIAESASRGIRVGVVADGQAFRARTQQASGAAGKRAA